MISYREEHSVQKILKREMDWLKQQAYLKFYQSLQKLTTEMLYMFWTVYGKQCVSPVCLSLIKWSWIIRKLLVQQTACNTVEWRQCEPGAEQCEHYSCQKEQKNAKRVGILIAICHTILSKALKMHCVCQHIVPRMLKQEQCDDHMRITELINVADNGTNFLQKSVIGNKMWHFLYSPQRK